MEPQSATRRERWLRVCAVFSSTAIAAVACGGAATTSVDAPIPAEGGNDGNDGASMTDASFPPGAVLDGGAGAEGGPGGDAAALPCGAIACPTAGAICCAYPQGSGGFAYACVGGSTCPASDGGTQTPTVLGCTSAANCAGGTVCCVRRNDDNQGAASSTTECKPSCGSREAQLCDPGAATSGCAGAACSSANIASWSLPASFATCGGVRAQ